MGDVICDYSQNLSNKPQTNQQLCALTLSQNTFNMPHCPDFYTQHCIFILCILLFSSVLFWCEILSSRGYICQNFLQQPWRILNSELNLMLHKRYIHGEKKKGDNKFSDGNRQGRSQNGRDLVFTLFKKWAGQTVTQKPWIHLINVLE